MEVCSFIAGYFFFVDYNLISSTTLFYYQKISITLIYVYEYYCAIYRFGYSMACYSHWVCVMYMNSIHLFKIADNLRSTTKWYV